MLSFQYKSALFLRSFVFYCGYAAIFLFFGCLIPLCLMLPQRRAGALLMRSCDAVLRWAHLCCGIRYRLEGTEHLPQTGPCVLCSNHQSPWETYMLMRLFPGHLTVGVVKRELLSIPVFGWGLRVIGHIPVDRGARRQAMQRLLGEGEKVLRQGISVVVFPEGTRIMPGQNKAFSQGAARLAIQADCPLVPVAHNAGECWPGRRFIKYPGEITVSIGPALHADDGDAKAMTRQAEAWVRARQRRLPAARRDFR